MMTDKRKHPLAICEISLTNSNKRAIIDEDDLSKVTLYRWYETPNGYIKCTSHISKRFLHQLILDTNMDVDHKNGNRFDCRKENLRAATRAQNLANSASRGGTSKFKGIYWNGRKWIANITIDYKCKYLGSFDSEEKAAKAYDEAAKEAFGEFARTNF